LHLRAFLAKLADNAAQISHSLFRGTFIVMDVNPV
jgi:hypothetical protein